MSTAAQAFANKQNAKASSGPITPEGKAASSRNAASHGLSSAIFALLPGEDPIAYRTSLAAFTQTLRPTDIHETHLVETMVQSRWKLARAQRMEAALVHQMMKLDKENTTPEAVVAAALLNGTAGPYKTLQRYQAAAERGYFKALRTLEDGRRALKGKTDTGVLVNGMAAPAQNQPQKPPVQNKAIWTPLNPHHGARKPQPPAGRGGCPTFNQRVAASGRAA